MARPLFAALLLAGPAVAAPLNLAGLAKVATVSDRYQSYNIEMVEVTGGRFWAPYGGPPNERYRQRPALDLADPRLLALARHLAPAYVRVSGTWSNNSYLPAAGETVTAPPAGNGRRHLAARMVALGRGASSELYSGLRQPASSRKRCSRQL